jgi:outer membrane protein OmpA-like peptidoglycan-associated protein
MITLKKACLLTTVSLMFSASAFADANKEVVKDFNRNIVHSSNGNCVITMWDSATDECAGKAPAPAAPVISKEMLNVYFDFNKSTLNAKEKAKLDTVSKLIKESKDVQNIDIAGYADSIGKDSYNKKLSAKRAETVKAYLAKKGLKTRRLTVEAYGENHPVTKCDPSLAKKDLITCLSEDRRVEIKLIMKE